MVSPKYNIQTKQITGPTQGVTVRFSYYDSKKTNQTKYLDVIRWLIQCQMKK